MSTTKLMTAEDLERLPDDGYRYELVRGELVRMTPVNYQHFKIVNLIAYHLTAWVLPRALGDVGPEGGFVLARGPDTVRAPDLVFVRAERAPQGEAELHYAHFAPDLAVEVRSPSESLISLLEKADEYLAAGSKLVWIFDPVAERVHVKTPDGQTATVEADGELDGGEVLPGFRLPLRKVFGGSRPRARQPKRHRS